LQGTPHQVSTPLSRPKGAVAARCVARNHRDWLLAHDGTVAPVAAEQLAADSPAASPDDFVRLPPRVRKLGTQMNYQEPGAVIRTIARDRSIRVNK